MAHLLAQQRVAGFPPSPSTTAVVKVDSVQKVSVVASQGTAYGHVSNWPTASQSILIKCLEKPVLWALTNKRSRQVSSCVSWARSRMPQRLRAPSISQH